MKTTICFAILLLVFCSMYSNRYQTVKESNLIEQDETGNNFLYIDIDSTDFTIFRQIIYIDPDEKRRKYNDSIDSVMHHYRTRADDILSEGTVKINNNEIICYDSLLKRYYTFTKINDSTIVATKHTALFVKGDTLKWAYGW